MAIYDPDTGANNGQVSVGSSSTSVLSTNRNRKFAILVNDSDEAIYVALGSTAVMNKGIRLNASGGNLIIDEKYTGPVSAICSSGSKVLTYCQNLV